MIINPESLNIQYYICNKIVADYLIYKKGKILLSVVGDKYYFSKDVLKELPIWVRIFNF
jgi:hypothetical protein